MRKTEVSIIETLNKEMKKYFFVPPFFVWFIIRYIVLGLFGVETILKHWDNESDEVKITSALFFFVGLIIAGFIDITKLFILFTAELFSLLYIPLIDRILLNKYKVDVSLNKNETLN